MNGALKVALGGVGAFLVYEWFNGSATTNTVPVATPAPATSNVPVAAVAISLSSLTASQMLGYVAAGGGSVAGTPLLTASQWNYYLTAATGLPGMALGDAGAPMDVNAYLSLVKAYAVSKGLAGLGIILDLGPIYNSRKTSNGFGDEEFFQGLSGIVSDADNSAAYVDEGPMKAGASRGGSLDSSTIGFYLADGYSV